MDRTEKTIILITILALVFLTGLAMLTIGCSDVPYTRPLMSIDDVISSAGDHTICLDDGFDTVCVKAIPGRDGQDGRDGQNGKDGQDGKDGHTFIAVHEVPVEVFIETIIEAVVIQEVVKEVPVEVVVERVVTEFVDREVPIEVFVERTVEVIKEVVVEKEVIKEVPVEVIIEKIIYQTEVVYQTPPETPPTIIENKLYDSQEYLDWLENSKPDGQHEHTFWHTHNGKRHGHRIVHPNGQADNWEREHDGYGGVSHE